MFAPPHVHLHIDDSGHNFLCDGSACRPANDPPVLNRALLGYPVR